MTVASQTSRASYLGDGSTKTFTVPFYFLADAHISVLVRATNGAETLLTLGSGYSVSGSGNPAGGSVTLATAPASGASVTVVRSVPATQEIDYQPNDTFPANTHEMALDKLTMLAQQIYEQLGRAIKISASSGANAADLVATPAERAQKILAFDASGNPVAITNNAVAAKTSEDAANAAKVAAQAAQAAAEGARDQTLTAYDNFNYRYLGPKTTNPTVDNDGNALVGGNLYYNTIAQEMRLWTGSQWVTAYVQGNAAGISFSPTGNIAASNVQAALAELDSEKAAIGHNHDSSYLSLGGGTVNGSVTANKITAKVTGSGNGLELSDATLGTQWAQYLGIGYAWSLYSYVTGNVGLRFSVSGAGDVTAAGNITGYSDEKLKKDWRGFAPDFLEKLAQVKSGRYTRKDTGKRQVGVSAQALQKVLPEAVCSSGEYLSVAYGNAALAAAVALAREVVALRAEVEALKAGGSQ